MAFLTDRKRATGLGSARQGTHHHWQMIVTAALLLPLVVLFVFTFGRVLGQPYEVVVAYYARPFPAIIAALTFLVGFVHFRGGVQTLIEDYLQGTARKVALIAMIGLSYTAAAIGIFAVARLAL